MKLCEQITDRYEYGKGAGIKIHRGSTACNRMYSHIRKPKYFQINALVTVDTYLRSAKVIVLLK